jgi:geranylgeranyl reductase family protein
VGDIGVTVSDVAVVGAGPAGSWAAYRLASAGARVALFDPSHPREKPCGGGVTQRALDLVASAVCADAIEAVRIRRARFVHSAAGTSATVPLEDQALLVASRSAFDQRLLDAARRAGARLVTRRVADVAREGSRFAITTADGRRCAASLVVGTDGANSLVRRRLAQPFERRQLSIATGYFARGVTSDEITIELLAEPPGYIWSFPRPDHLAIGICAQADAGVSAESLRAITRRWMHRTGIGDGATVQPYSWPVPSLADRDFRVLTVGGAGWLLAGDAAGLVDPITREGIFFALQSAAYAADAIAEGPGASRRYAQRVKDEILPELGRAARFKASFYRPRFTALLMDALGGSPAIRAVLADLVSGRQGYRGLKWRLVGTLEWGWAARVLGGIA